MAARSEIARSNTEKKNAKALTVELSKAFRRLTVKVRQVSSLKADVTDSAGCLFGSRAAVQIGHELADRDGGDG